MKKSFLRSSLLLLLGLIVLGTSATYAQSSIPKVWLDTAGTYVGTVATGAQWFKTTSSAVRGMAYNPVTNHVLVASRDSLFNCIMILNGTNGDTLGRLNMTGITGGTFAFNRVAVSADGRIYTANLVTTVSKAAPIKIYTWTDESSAPTLAFSDSVLGPRVGDALAVVGSAQETYVYLSGNAAPGPVTVFQRSGDSLLVRKSITLTGWANGILGFGPITNGFGSFWVKSSGKAASSYDTSGTPLDTIPSAVGATGYTTVHYYAFAGRKYVVMYSGNTTPSVFRVIDVTNGGLSSYIAGVTTSLGSISNTNATAEVIFNPSDTTLIALATNNGVGKFNIKAGLPVVTLASRAPYIPAPASVDTVNMNIASVKAMSTVKLYYYGYKTVSSDQAVPDSGNVTMTTVNGRTFTGVIPGSLNRDGRRVTFWVEATDNLNLKTSTTLFPGYFAGITKFGFVGGPREVDTSGTILWNAYAIRMKGVCIQEDTLISSARTDIVLQDSLGGSDFIDFTVPFPIDIKRGNVYTIEGPLAQFNGKLQVGVPAGLTHFVITDNGPGILPVPVKVTVGDMSYAKQGEVVENALIRIENVHLTPGSLAWPGAAAVGTNLTITDNGTDSITLRIPANTKLNGYVPTQNFTVIGVAGQFGSATAKKIGYQIIARDTLDVFPYVAPPPPIVPMGVTLKTSKIQTTVTNVGHIGGVSAFQDMVGFKFGGTERLFEGSHIFTTDSAHVSNAWRDRNGDYTAGFRPLKNIKIDTVGSTFRVEAAYNDSSMVRPLGITVVERTLVDTTAAKAGYLMVQFNIINTTNAKISKLRAGTFMDFDMTAAGNVDRGGIVKDSTNVIVGVNSGNPFKMHVAYEQAGGVNTAFVGVVALSQGQLSGGRISSGAAEIYPSGIPFSDSIKNNLVSTFRATNTFSDNQKNDDQSIIASFGPYDINAKDTAKAAFAVISGTSLGDLIATARQAQKDYVAIGNPFGPVTKVDPEKLPLTFALEQNFPNPFNPTTMIRFSLPNDSKVSLKIYDILGREVRSLVSGDVAAGIKTMEWNGRNNSGQSVASGVYIYRVEAGSFVATKKMMLLK